MRTKILNCTSSVLVNPYPLIIQRGLLTDSVLLKSHLKELASSFAVITNESIRSLYGEQLTAELNKSGLKTDLFSFPDGEIYKTRATKESLEDALFRKKFGKDSCILALGGGVVTDLVGYLAATYCRGIPLVLIPTGLLGMVDACIGGKTGVNTSFGKNLIGSLYFPKKVFIDPLTLQSLPLREIRGGMVEVIKHALTSDQNLFSYLETHAKSILQLESDCIDDAILKNCQIKQKIIEQDPQEKGKRHLLNAGHTVGHALEILSQYTLSHGEAVALGLLIEGEIAVQLGTLSSEEWNRIYQLLKLYQLPLELPDSILLDQLLETMIFDKKTQQNKPRFIILKGIGSACEYGGNYCTSVDEILIINAFNKVKDALRHH